MKTMTPGKTGFVYPLGQEIAYSPVQVNFWFRAFRPMAMLSAGRGVAHQMRITYISVAIYLNCDGGHDMEAAN
jgi:hypothetical protein